MLSFEDFNRVTISNNTLRYVHGGAILTTNSADKTKSGETTDTIDDAGCTTFCGSEDNSTCDAPGCG